MWNCWPIGDCGHGVLEAVFDHLVSRWGPQSQCMDSVATSHFLRTTTILPAIMFHSFPRDPTFRKHFHDFLLNMLNSLKGLTWSSDWRSFLPCQTCAPKSSVQQYWWTPDEMSWFVCVLGEKHQFKIVLPVLNDSFSDAARESDSVIRQRTYLRTCCSLYPLEKLISACIISWAAAAL